MTEMVFGTVPLRAGDPVIPRWWRTIDKLSLFCVMILFGIGILLALAASVPLAEKNGLDPYHYVVRQLGYGTIAFAVLLVISLMSPDMVRRLGVIGGLCAFVALALLPAGESS